MQRIRKTNRLDGGDRLRPRAIMHTCLLAAFAQVLVQVGRTDPVEPTATFGVTHSDNLLRSRTEEASDTVVDAGVGARIAMGGRIFRLDGDAAFRHREFTEHTVGSENLPAVNLRASANLVPEVLAWIADESMGQVAPQPFDSLTPDDQQTASYFSTGPSLYLPIGTRGRFESDLRYGLVNYSGSAVDSRRYSGEVGLGRLLTPTNTVSVNYTRKRVEYDQRSVPTSTSDAAFVRYSVNSSRSQLVGEAGTESSQVGPGGTTREPHLVLGLQRRISRRTTLSVEFAHGYSDAAENLRVDLRDTFNAGGVQNILVVAEPFKSDRGYLNLVRGGGRMMIALQVDGARERYSTRTNLNRNIYGAGIAIDYQLSSLTSAAVKVTLQKEALVNDSLSSRYGSATIGLNRRFGPSVRCTLGVQHLQASGNVDRYRESRILLSLTYSPRPSRKEIFNPDAGFRYFDRSFRATPVIEQPSVPGSQPLGSEAPEPATDDSANPSP